MNPENPIEHECRDWVLRPYFIPTGDGGRMEIKKSCCIECGKWWGD